MVEPVSLTIAAAETGAVAAEATQEAVLAATEAAQYQLELATQELAGASAEIGDAVIDPDAALASSKEYFDKAAMNKVNEAFHSELRPMAERYSSAREQLQQLPESSRYNAERARLTMAESSAVGRAGEIYTSEVYSKFGEMIHPWRAPNGKAPDFFQQVTESYRVADVVSSDGTINSDEALVGDRIVHEPKTSEHIDSSGEWSRLKGQIEGTIEGMKNGSVDKMYIHVGNDFELGRRTAEKVREIPDSEKVYVVADLPVSTIRSVFVKTTTL